LLPSGISVSGIETWVQKLTEVAYGRGDGGELGSQYPNASLVTIKAQSGA